MSELVIFDLDGTLVNSRQDLASAANAARAHLGLEPLPTDVVQTYVGEGARNLVLRAIGAEHKDRVEEALAAFFSHYGHHLIVATTVYPGLVELLRDLGARKAVLTNKPGRFARPLCEGLGISKPFKVIWGEGDVPARKPDPRGALELCAQLGVRPEDARFVGDSKIDAATALNAKIPFVGVTWGYGTEAQMREHGATRFAHDAAGLLRALKD